MQWLHCSVVTKTVLKFPTGPHNRDVRRPMASMQRSSVAGAPVLGRSPNPLRPRPGAALRIHGACCRRGGKVIISAVLVSSKAERDAWQGRGARTRRRPWVHTRTRRCHSTMCAHWRVLHRAHRTAWLGRSSLASTPQLHGAQHQLCSRVLRTRLQP